MVPPVTGGVVLESGARVGADYSDALMAEKLRGLADFESRLAAMPVASGRARSRSTGSLSAACSTATASTSSCCVPGRAIPVSTSIR